MTPGLDPFAPGAADALVLLGLRVGGMMLVAPAFTAAGMPKTLRAGLLILLTLLVAPAAVATAGGAARLTPASAATETVIGLAMGLGVAMIAGAAEMAGEVLAIQIGLNGSALIDPMEGTSINALGVFMRLFAVTLLLSFNLHTVVLGALADSTESVRVGSALDASHGALAVVEMGAVLFALGVKMAAPVMGVVLVANVALAVAGRAAPQLNLLTLAFPIQIMLGLAALAASLPLIGRWLAGWDGVYGGLLLNASRALGAAAH